MWKLNVLLLICLISAEALPRKERIVGGSVVNINQYPYAAVMLVSTNNAAFRQDCGGTILNNRSIMSAAHCWVGRHNTRFTVRIGSTNANSGGVVHNVNRHITHPSYNVGGFMNNDIGIVRLATVISFNNNVRAGSIAGSNFHLPDNTLVWSIGWGLTAWQGNLSEQLRHVQLRTTNQAECQRIYGSHAVNANMICAGWHTDGRGSCTADSGGPLLHNHVAFGIVSFGTNCGQARWPGVYTRVSRYTSWVQSNS